MSKAHLHVLEDFGGLRGGNKVALGFLGEDNFGPQRLLDLMACPRSSGGRLSGRIGMAIRTSRSTNQRSPAIGRE